MSGGSERANYQSFLAELCDLLGVPRPDPARPDDLAAATLSALQGGILLAQTQRTSRPLRLAIDMAIDHIAHYVSGTP